MNRYWEKKINAFCNNKRIIPSTENKLKIYNACKELKEKMTKVYLNIDNCLYLFSLTKKYDCLDFNKRFEDIVNE